MTEATGKSIPGKEVCIKGQIQEYDTIYENE